MHIGLSFERYIIVFMRDYFPAYADVLKQKDPLGWFDEVREQGPIHPADVQEEGGLEATAMLCLTRKSTVPPQRWGEPRYEMYRLNDPIAW